MKGILKYRFIFLVLAGGFLCNVGVNTIYAQKGKKNSVRLKAYYTKVMDSVSYFNVKAFSRINKENIDVSNIDLIFYNEQNGEKIKLGTATTDMHGECMFVLKNFHELKPDSTHTYNINISFKGNDAYKKTSKSIRFKDATILAKLITKDSINHITAVLKDTAKDSVMADQIVNVQVQRLFRNLRIGDEFNSTNESGTIIVPIKEEIPGVNGHLTFEVVLKDSDEYGTVKALVNASIGKPIKDESTFDQRTMWSPRNKTPLFLLIFPNLLTIGIWGIIVYLIINLFKISKSKN